VRTREGSRRPFYSPGDMESDRALVVREYPGL
jgi:hypothetical protein